MDESLLEVEVDTTVSLPPTSPKDIRDGKRTVVQINCSPPP